MDGSKEIAKKYSLQLPRITAIEIPGKVINDDRAVHMIGGKERLSKVCKDRGDSNLELRFRPEDSYEHPILSSSSKVQNLVLKIQVPKKALETANGDIQKTLKSLPTDKIIVTPSHFVETTFRFRELSDFQYNTRKSKFIHKVNHSILTGNYESIQSYEFDKKEPFTKSKNNDIIPPPQFSPLKYPFNYGYRQNPALMAVDDGNGGHTLINKSGTSLLHAQYISFQDDPPKSPSKELQKLTDPKHIECYHYLNSLFEQRPIWTRRALTINLPPHLRQSVKHVLHYVSFTMSNGPWRSAVIKYGIDVRSSKEYRIYQTRWFRYSSSNDDDITNRNVLPYQFDGVHMIAGSVLQFCDITDPDLKTLIENSKTLDVVDKDSGWFDPLDFHKIKALLYLKQKAIVDKTPLSEAKIQEALQSKPNVSSNTKNEEAEGDTDEVNLYDNEDD